MRHVVVGLFAVLLLTALPWAARACINDREIERSEREFKSLYQQPAAAPTAEPAPPQGQGLPLAFLGGGAVLLLGATLSVLHITRRSDAA